MRRMMCTYIYGVSPTDLCLEFCEAYEQDYIIVPLVRHFSHRRVL